MANRFKDIEAQLNGQRIPSVSEAGAAYNRDVQESEEKLRQIVTNPLGAIKDAAAPTIPVQQPSMTFSPKEQTKNADAWREFTGSRPAAPSAAQLDEQAQQDADLEELRGSYQNEQMASKPEPKDLLKDPRVFEMIKLQLGAK